MRVDSTGWEEVAAGAILAGLGGTAGFVFLRACTGGDGGAIGACFFAATFLAVSFFAAALGA